jgi:hypothetical protein
VRWQDFGGQGPLVQNSPTNPAPGQALPIADANEVQAAKVALNLDITNATVGILHIPTNRVHLRPISQTNPPGHAALVQQMKLNRNDCRGFVVAITPGGKFVVENLSGLNVGSGGTTNLQMPQSIFDKIQIALASAGL